MAFAAAASRDMRAPAFNRTPSFSTPRAMPQQARPAAGNFNRAGSLNNAIRAIHSMV